MEDYKLNFLSTSSFLLIHFLLVIFLFRSLISFFSSRSSRFVFPLLRFPFISHFSIPFFYHFCFSVFFSSSFRFCTCLLSLFFVTSSLAFLAFFWPFPIHLSSVSSFSVFSYIFSPVSFFAWKVNTIFFFLTSSASFCSCFPYPFPSIPRSPHPCVFCFSVRILGPCFIFSLATIFFFFSLPLSFLTPCVEVCSLPFVPAALSCLSFILLRLFLFCSFLVVSVRCLLCCSSRVMQKKSRRSMVSLAQS